jgi:two-component system, NtrC family, sensor histidine kinase PilS
MTLLPRLSQLIAIRVVVSTLLLGSAILIQINRPGTFPVDPFFLLIGLTYALSVLYLATLRFAERHAWLVDLQFGADAVLVSAFVYVTGGVTSYFTSLTFLPVIAASSLRSRQRALQVATLSAALYLGLVAAQYNVGGVGPSFVDLPSVGFAQFTVAIHLFGLLAVALLSGSLAERLRQTGARLADASAQIKDLRAFNQHVIDSLLSGLATVDLEGRILTFNRAALAITGLTAREAVGRDAATVLQLPGDFHAGLATVAERRSLGVEIEYRRQDGRVIDVGLTAAALTVPDGTSGYLLTFQDVTEVRRLQRDARLHQRLAAVGEMAAGIAHEIRNPLASMAGCIEVLKAELALSGEHAQLMAIVLRESDRLNETVRSFLSYARPGRFAVARLDVRRVVEDAALLLRDGSDMNAAHEIRLDLPQEPVWYEADEHQLRQVVLNLGTNGLQAMADGGVLHLGARVQPSLQGHTEVVVSVQDEGRGMSGDELERMFQPVEHAPERPTGLGLAIVHHIVGEYDGAIEVSSTLATGTTVHVRLPVRAALAASAQVHLAHDADHAMPSRATA